MADSNNNEGTVDKSDDMQNGLLVLKSCKEWLEKQKLDYDVKLNMIESQNVPTSEDLVRLSESISRLQQQLLDETASKAIKSLILERLLLGQVQSNQLFPGKHEPLCDKSLLENYEEQLTFNTNMMKYHEALEEEKSTLRDLKLKNAAIRKTNQELMKQLKDIKNEEVPKPQDEPAEYTRIKDEIIEIQNMITVVNNIFQGLVVGSKIDWAEDDELRETVLSLGKPLNFLKTS